jgi:nucleoside-diphosphate-sugar epimerase
LLIEYLKSGKFKILGNGRNVLNFVDPRDAAHAMYLAAMAPNAASQLYHITNDSHANTQEDLYQMVSAQLNCRPPSLHVPFTLALGVSWIMERWAEWRKWDDAPMLTPVRVKFLGLNRDFSCEKAKRELGYKPKFSLQQSLVEAVGWYNKLNAFQRSLIPELQLAQSTHH